ncbi:MAG: hypothetical protein NT016_02440 [Candidatus Aenigmarchaeota archaeon]|nr:hypothetical protein [Candidatus Aenigmarchaeota archaeon]
MLNVDGIKNGIEGIGKYLGKMFGRPESLGTYSIAVPWGEASAVEVLYANERETFDRMGVTNLMNPDGAHIVFAMTKGMGEKDYREVEKYIGGRLEALKPDVLKLEKKMLENGPGFAEYC